MIYLSANEWILKYLILREGELQYFSLLCNLLFTYNKEKVFKRMEWKKELKQAFA